MIGFFPASIIARAAGRSSKTVLRLARREGWRSQTRNGRRFFVPPAPLAKKCHALGDGVQFVNKATTLRELSRAAVVLAFFSLRALNPDEPDELLALRCAAEMSKILKFSPESLMRWARTAEKLGLAGLCERKSGRSGRRQKAAEPVEAEKREQL